MLRLGLKFDSAGKPHTAYSISEKRKCKSNTEFDVMQVVLLYKLYYRFRTMKGCGRSARKRKAKVSFNRGQSPLVVRLLYLYFFLSFFFYRARSVKIFLPLRSCEAAGE